MERKRSDQSNHLETVAELIYGKIDQITQIQHLELITERGIDSSLTSDQIDDVQSYCDSHLTEPELLASAKLSIAQTYLSGIRETSLHRETLRDYKFSSEDNQRRFDSANSILQQIEVKQLNVPQIKQVFSVCHNLKKFNHNNDYKNRFNGTFTMTTAINPDVNDKIELDIALTTIELNLIDRLKNEKLDSDEIQGISTIEFYLNLFYFQDIKSSYLGPKIIKSILELADPSMDNIINNLFELRHRNPNHYLNNEILDKCLEITANSDRSPIKKVEKIHQEPRFSLFGLISNRVIDQVVDGPSSFEQRLFLLDKLIKDFGYGTREGSIIYNYPNFIAKVIDLHPPEEQMKLWQDNSDNVALKIFSNGHYKIEDLKRVVAFRRDLAPIVPTEVSANTMKLLTERIAISSPQP